MHWYIISAPFYFKIGKWSACHTCYIVLCLTINITYGKHRKSSPAQFFLEGVLCTKSVLMYVKKFFALRMHGNSIQAPFFSKLVIEMTCIGSIFRYNQGKKLTFGMHWYSIPAPFFSKVVIEVPATRAMLWCV